MKWFRVHHAVFTNTKFKRLSTPERYYYLHLYYLASINSERGAISDLDDEEIAFELDLETEDWLTLKAKLRVKGFIEFGRKTLIITNWSKEQYASDSSTERVRKHRNAKTKRFSHVSETPMKHTNAVTVTPPDQNGFRTDSDSEKVSLSPKGSLPQKNLEREGGANALGNMKAIAPPSDEPDQNPTLGNKSSSVKGQSSAPPRGPVENAQAHYSQLPPYRVSWKAGDYQPLYLADMLKRMRSQWPDRTASDAVARLENAEREGKFGFIESDYAEFLERQRRQNQPPTIASPSEEATRQAANRLPQDLGETISAIQAKLQLLNWSTRDLARYMQQSGRWTCKNGATAGLLQGKSKDLSRCHDDEILEILDAIAPLNPQEINHV